MQEQSIVYLNPRDLLPSKRNVRSDPGDLAGLAETIREHGILQPLGVVREKDVYRVVYGHRRRDAAIVVGLDRVPCLLLNEMAEDVVKEGLARLEVDRYGLERHDRDILRSVIEKYGGGPVGAETLAISVGESVETLEDYCEPYLIQAGFLQRTPRGRVAAPLAYEHLGYRNGHADERLLF